MKSSIRAGRMSWLDWQRFEDYYDEAALIWLDADTLDTRTLQGRPIAG